MVEHSAGAGSPGFPAPALWLALGVAVGGIVVTPVHGHADIHAGFRDSTITVAVGDTFTTHVAIRRVGSPFNAFDASVRFDPAMLSFDPMSSDLEQRGALMTSACGNIFHRFRAAADSLRFTVSLLCARVNTTGPGTIYRIRFRAGPRPGTTAITLGPFTEFYRAGLFVRPLQRQGMTVTIVPAGGSGHGGDRR